MLERTKERGGWAARIWALATVALLFGLLWRFTDMHYALGDDFYLARAFAGEVGGVPETYNLYVHTFFAYLLNGLTRLFPNVWWFSFLQLTLLFLGCYGVLLGLMRLAERLRTPLWAGWLIGVFFLAAFAVEFCTTITFTTTSAVLGAGAVCLLGGVDMRAPERRVALGVLGSTLPLLCAFLLRGVSALPALAFWLGLGLYRLLANAARPAIARFAWKPVACGALAAALLGGLAIGVRSAENALLSDEDRSYAEFLNATVIPIDYGGLNDVTEETLAELHWTDATLAMIRSWYFMDESMSAASFRRTEADALAKAAPPLRERLSAARAQLVRLFERSENVWDFWLVCLWMCTAAFSAAAFLKAKRYRLWGMLASVGCAGLAALLLGYLALKGRLPMRAAATVLLPACAMAVALVLSVFEEQGDAESCPPSKGKVLRFAQKNNARSCLRALPALAALLMALAAMAHAACTAFSFYYNPTHGDPNQCVYAGVDAYVLAHEDQLFIGDRTLGVDRRLFPDRSAGKPINLLPMWGGWNNHSQGYRALFARYGLQHDAFSVTELLGDTVRLITGAQGVSPELLTYLTERAGRAVSPVIEAEGNSFTVYRFE